MRRVLVVGLAATGAAVVERLVGEGCDLVVVEDRPGGDAYQARAAAARALGAEIVEAPSPGDVASLAASVDLVVPSPLVAATHPAIVAAYDRGVPVRSEIDLAAERTPVPIVAVTGTNGKSTVTTLIAAMLEASGRRAIAAGNIGRALLDAVDDDTDYFVVEVSSFQLAFAESFRPRVAVLLGVAPDHLDWHGSFEDYVAAKARVFEHQRAGDLLVFDADDAVAADLAGRAPARTIGVSIDPSAVTGFRRVDDVLVDADGKEIVRLDAMGRALPHDCTNALAAAAAAFDVGATHAGVEEALRVYTTLPHRVALVREHGGVRYYDDSKATNPHAALHALSSFDSVVLLAGGRNKGLDLAALTEGAAHLKAVVGFGEAAPEIEVAFAGIRPVVRADSMRAAVRAAADLAKPGDVVLLSPGCASFDAYSGYAARGDDFASEVRAL
ncbi:MAG: UDP-N-acetylmuramoyl-L-alanine--D-glutamate ligase [Actinomycetota bacterium]|nr:UDP-N-acetylmuramoyl-L-alanine--D-glutamate ligase [Actinomycetota bacterium]